MMTDDAILLAYVDGDLPPDERRKIEARIQASSETAERVALLRASQLDFADAFAHRKLPPVPESLTHKIEEMVRAHQLKGAQASPAASVPVSANDTSIPSAPSAPVRSRLRAVPVWLAAACVAGAFACGLFLRLGPLLNPGVPVEGGTAVASAGAGLSWVAAATGYQKLYTRETVAYTQEDPAVFSKIIDDIRHEDRLAIRVPDLSSAGLTFKWVQRLSFNNKPLVQIVYLPQKGPPIALCVMKEVKPDQAVTAKTVDAMNVVTWRQAELSYALIGKAEGVDLNALGRQISNREMEQLFSSASRTLLAKVD
jgi:anti-sigma factor RsiW